TTSCDSGTRPAPRGRRTGFAGHRGSDPRRTFPRRTWSRPQNALLPLASTSQPRTSQESGHETTNSQLRVANPELWLLTSADNSGPERDVPGMSGLFTRVRPHLARVILPVPSYSHGHARQVGLLW